MRALAAIAVGVLAAACGGLDNRPLMMGAVEGRAVECMPGGVIGVVGDPEVRTVPDASCAFRLQGVKPGPQQLYVAPTDKKVTLVPVEVQASQLSEVGDVMARPGAFVRVQVSAPGSAGADLSGEVLAPDLPIAASPVGRSGAARIGPFPDGCYRLEVNIRGLGKRAASSCLTEGDEEDLEIEY